VGGKTGHLRCSISDRDLDKLLRSHATDERAKKLLRQLVSELQVALSEGLPLLAKAGRAARAQMLGELRELEKALGTLALLLRKRSGALRLAVSEILGSEIARLLTDQAFADAGVPLDSPSSHEICIIRSRAREPDLAVAEEMQSRRAMRTKQSVDVLASLHVRCHALIAAQLEFERGGKGGRPAHPEREFILVNIAMVFEEVFGIAPTSSETGKYVLLCEEILRLFDLETQGVEYAAKRTIAKLRLQRPSRSKPKK
jgi:hypothetical protein